MNRYFQSIISLVFLCIVLAAVSCKQDDPELTESERVTSLLILGPWKVQTVTVGGVDKTPEFTGLQLAFTASSFMATNGHLVWPASGTWAFTSDNATAFNRNDNVTVTIDEVTDTKLVLSLTWAGTTYGPGRVTSVAGEHKFTFNK